MNLTDNPTPQLGLLSDTADSMPLLVKLDQTLVDLGFAEYTEQKGGTFNIIMLTVSLMMGIFSTRINNTGVVARMLVGLTSTLVYIFTDKGWFFVPDTNMLANTPDNWFLGIAPEAFGALGAMLNFAISSKTKPVSEDIRELVKSIRVPKGAADAQDH